MRILTVCDTCGIGGKQRVAANFAMAFKSQGHESAYLAYKEDGVRRPDMEEVGVSVFVGGDQLDEALAQAVDFKPDLVHIHRTGHTREVQTRIMRALRETGCRIVEMNVFSRVDRLPGPPLIDVHLQLSEWCLWRWLQRGGSFLNDRNGVVIPNAADETRFYPATAEEAETYRRETLGLPEGAFLCGRIGQPIPAKWHPCVVDAFVALAEQNPKAHLALIGVPDNIKARIEQLPAGIRQRVHLLEMTSDDNVLRTFYTALDVMLHAAQIGESFGLVLVESMYCGTPVITASRPFKDNSQVSVVRHEQDGLVAASTKYMPEALLRFHNDQALQASCRQNLRERTIERFSQQKVVGQVIRVGELAIAHHDPAELRKALQAEPDLVTDVTPARLRAMLDHAVGKPNPIEIMKMHLVHKPLVNRVIDAILKWRRGLS